MLHYSLSLCAVCANFILCLHINIPILISHRVSYAVLFLCNFFFGAVVVVVLHLSRLFDFLPNQFISHSSLVVWSIYYKCDDNTYNVNDFHVAIMFFCWSLCLFRFLPWLWLRSFHMMNTFFLFSCAMDTSIFQYRPTSHIHIIDTSTSMYVIDTNHE